MVGNSPDHSGKYLTFSMFDQTINTIVSMFVTQATKAVNSNNMERFEFIKNLNNLKEKNVLIKQIPTDWHR